MILEELGRFLHGCVVIALQLLDSDGHLLLIRHELVLDLGYLDGDHIVAVQSHIELDGCHCGHGGGLEDNANEPFALAYKFNNFHGSIYETHLIYAHEQTMQKGTIERTDFKMIYGNADRIVLRIQKMFPAPEKDVVMYEEVWGKHNERIDDEGNACQGWDRKPFKEVKHENRLNNIIIFKIPQYQGNDRKRALFLARKYKKIIWNPSDAEEYKRPVLEAPYYVIDPNYRGGHRGYVISHDVARMKRTCRAEVKGQFKSNDLHYLLHKCNLTIWSEFGSEIPEGDKWKGALTMTAGKSANIATLSTTAGALLCLIHSSGITPHKELKEWLKTHKATSAGYIQANPKNVLAKGLAKFY